MIIIDSTNTLNDNQLEAVKYPGEHLMIIAGPGSGKSYTIVERVKWLIGTGADPGSILMLTFTNRAARVMKERLEGTPGDEVHASTFHSLSHSILRECLSGGKERFTVADADDQRRILRRILNDFGVARSPATAAEYMNLQKSKGIVPIYHDIQIYGTYEDYLSKHNLIDFGGLQIDALEFMDTDMGWRHILVDEFHDTSPVQMSMVKKLEVHAQTLTVVCDDQQSIYGWRGADITGILQIRDTYSGIRVVHLERNYRSTKAIVQSINSLVGHASEVLEEKNLWSLRRYGEVPTVTSCSNEMEEAKEVVGRIMEDGNYGEHMILMRTNGQSRALEAELMANEVPYKLVAATQFYGRTEVKDIVAYLRWLYNPSDEVALQRIINKPRRRLGKVTIGRIISRYGSLCEAVRNEEVLLPMRNLRRMTEEVVEHGNIREVMDSVLHMSGYLRMIREDSSETGADRSSNVDALLEGASEFVGTHGESTLGDYLTMVSLLSDTDEMDPSKAVHILTIHASKGMECRNVHIIGVEEGLLPHHMSVRDRNIEEERRLMYVGISRAMDTVRITWCQSRMLQGSIQSMRPSRFLRELGI